MKNLNFNNLNIEELNSEDLKKTEGGFLPMMAAAVIFIIMTEAGY